VSLTFGLEIRDALASRALAIVITRPWLDVLEQISFAPGMKPAWSVVS